MAQFSMTWEAPEFTYRDRDVSWYWISIIVAVAIVAFAVWQRNFLFGLFIVIAEILAIVWASRTPRMITFNLSDQELMAGTMKHYLMNTFESFSVTTGLHDDTFDEIIFHAKGKLRGSVMVAIPADLVEDTRRNLKTILREIEYEPTLIDSLEKIIGF